MCCPLPGINKLQVFLIIKERKKGKKKSFGDKCFLKCFVPTIGNKKNKKDTCNFQDLVKFFILKFTVLKTSGISERERNK